MAEGIQPVAGARLTPPPPAQAQASCCGPANATGANKHRGDPSILPADATGGAQPPTRSTDFGDMIAWAREAIASATGKGGTADRSEAGRVQRTAGSDRGSRWIPDHISGVLPPALAIAIQRGREPDGDGADASRTLPATGAGRLRRPPTLPADRLWAPQVVLPSVLPTTLPLVERRLSDNDR